MQDLESLFHNGDFERCIKTSRKMLRKKPADQSTASWLALSLTSTSGFHTALKVCNQTLKVTESDNIYHIRGEVLNRLGRLSHAIKSYSKCIAANFQRTDSLIAKCTLEYRLNRFLDCEKTAKQGTRA